MPQPYAIPEGTDVVDCRASLMLSIVPQSYTELLSGFLTHSYGFLFSTLKLGSIGTFKETVRTHISSIGLSSFQNKSRYDLMVYLCSY